MGDFMEYKFRHTEVYKGIKIDQKANTTKALMEKVQKKKKEIDEIREILKELFLLNTTEAMQSTNFKRCVMCLDLFENNKESL